MASPKAHGEAIVPAEDPVPSKESAESSDMARVIHNAKAATDKEQNMTLLQGIKLYPKAVAWSAFISLCIVMEGYDISLVNNFYAFPQFKKKYGELTSDGSYEVTAPVCPFPFPFFHHLT